MIHMLKRMEDYDRWASRRTLESVAALPEPSERALVLLSHLLASRLRWLGMIDGEDLGLMDTWPRYSLAECTRLSGELEGRLRSRIDGLEKADLDKVVSYTNPKGEYLEFKWGDTLLHSLLHSQYHRAQIASEVRSIGGQPASTDYIVMCKEEFQLQAAGKE